MASPTTKILHADSAARLGVITASLAACGCYAAVLVIESDDVVFADIIAALHFYQTQSCPSGVFEAML